jgi:hypothetical protein
MALSTLVKEKLNLDMTKYEFEHNHQRKVEFRMAKYEFEYVHQRKFNVSYS